MHWYGVGSVERLHGYSVLGLTPEGSGGLVSPPTCYGWEKTI